MSKVTQQPHSRARTRVWRSNQNPSLLLLRQQSAKGPLGCWQVFFPLLCHDPTSTVILRLCRAQSHLEVCRNNLLGLVPRASDSGGPGRGPEWAFLIKPQTMRMLVSGDHKWRARMEILRNTGPGLSLQRRTVHERVGLGLWGQWALRGPSGDAG